MKTITLFWDWFRFNEKTLANLTKEKPKVQKLFMFWLDKHLHNYSEGLDCIIMLPEKPGGKLKLVISANGDPNYFDLVKALSKCAPHLPNWEITAFIQPSTDIDEMESGLDKPYVFKDITLKASELKFMPFEYESEKKIDMIVYLKDFTVHCNNKNLLQVIYIIMQDIIGEKSLYENVNFVELAQLPEQEDCELIYLYELQQYLDYINSSSPNKSL